MPLRFEIRADGSLQAVQSFEPPAVYLDHWAMMALSEDRSLGDRFVSTLKARGGTLVISHVNLAELAIPEDPRHADDAGQFLERLLPNIYCAQCNLEYALKHEVQFAKANLVGRRAPPPPDVEFLMAIAEQRPTGLQPFTIANVVRSIGSGGEIRKIWSETNRAISEEFKRHQRRLARKAKRFKDHPVHLPTLAILQELLRPAVLDELGALSQSDAADMQHAIVSLGCCDYALLDGKWQDRRDAMVRRFKELGKPIHVALVYSARKNGLQRFLSDFESAEVVRPLHGASVVSVKRRQPPVDGS